MTRARRHWLAAAAGVMLFRPAVAASGSAATAPVTGTPPATTAGARRDVWPRGRATPRIALKRLDGTPWSPAAALGHPLLLNFWASWCEPCRDEMPALQQLSDEWQPHGLRVLAVNYRESVATIARFLDHHALHLPVLRDAEGAAARALGVRIFPTTVALDRRGRAAFSVVGQVDWSAPSVRGWADSLLAA